MARNRTKRKMRRTRGGMNKVNETSGTNAGTKESPQSKFERAKEVLNAAVQALLVAANNIAEATAAEAKLAAPNAEATAAEATSLANAAEAKLAAPNAEATAAEATSLANGS